MSSRCLRIRYFIYFQYAISSLKKVAIGPGNLLSAVHHERSSRNHRLQVLAATENKRISYNDTRIVEMDHRCIIEEYQQMTLTCYPVIHMDLIGGAKILRFPQHIF